MSSADRTVVLVGPMAAGKTSVGRFIARATGLPFRDSDKHIVATHGPIPEIFAAHGEAYFRDLERAAVTELLDGGGVISLGGGAVIDPATRSRLAGVPVVFLTVSPEAVAARIAGSGRPLLAGEEDPLERWLRIFEERRDWYEAVADVAFDTSRLPMQRVAAQIVNWIEEQSR